MVLLSPSRPLAKDSFIRVVWVVSNIADNTNEKLLSVTVSATLVILIEEAERQ